MCFRATDDDPRISLKGCGVAGEEEPVAMGGLVARGAGWRWRRGSENAGTALRRTECGSPPPPPTEDPSAAAPDDDDPAPDAPAPPEKMTAAAGVDGGRRAWMAAGGGGGGGRSFCFFYFFSKICLPSVFWDSAKLRRVPDV